MQPTSMAVIVCKKKRNKFPIEDILKNDILSRAWILGNLAKKGPCFPAIGFCELGCGVAVCASMPPKKDGALMELGPITANMFVPKVAKTAELPL